MRNAVSQRISRVIPAPVAAYAELTKPRIVTMVLVTGAMGFFLAGGSVDAGALLAWTLAGMAMTAAGAGALNHFFEVAADSRMERTRNRPLPRGLVQPLPAFLFGAALSTGGVALLLWNVNLLTAFLALLTVFLYVVVYTPMKQFSWLNTLVGGIPGALPPMGGWAAATGQLDLGAWLLFAILFFWQQPHFYAIAWMYRDDYRRGGFKMLPVVEPDGRSTFRQVIFCLLVLVPVSVLPTLTGLTGWVYLVGALLLGAMFLARGWRFSRDGSHDAARGLLRASIIYLPLLLLLIALDRAV